MPFTLAHPAAILPLARAWRGRVIVSALVIGSMVPDLPNLFPNISSRAATHSLYGIVWFAVPVGLLLYGFFHLALARPLAELFPKRLRTQIEPFLRDASRFESSSLARAAFSIFLGALTHIVWDSFTHPGAPMVNALAILRTSWLRIGYEEFAGYRVLQLVSTVIGLGALGFWIRQWSRASGSPDCPTEDAPLDPLRAATLGVLFGVALGFAAHARPSAPAAVFSFGGVLRALRDAAIAGMDGLLFAVVVFSVVWHARLLLDRLRSSP